MSHGSENMHFELFIMHDIQRALKQGWISWMAGEKKQWLMPAAEHWLHRAFDRDDDGSTVHCRHNVVQRKHSIEGLANDMMGAVTVIVNCRGRAVMNCKGGG